MSIRGILILFISASIFDSIFNKLEKINSRIISPFHIVPEKWKGKWSIKWIAIIILLFMPAIMVNEYGINEILGHILSGFIISLCEFAFKKPLYNKFDKIEFSQMGEEQVEDQIGQIECPNCCETHDIDYPRCPFCKYNYYIQQNNKR